MRQPAKVSNIRLWLRPIGEKAEAAAIKRHRTIADRAAIQRESNRLLEQLMLHVGRTGTTAGTALREISELTGVPMRTLTMWTSRWQRLPARAHAQVATYLRSPPQDTP